MQLADHTNMAPVQHHRSRTPRMQGGVRHTLEAQLARRKQSLEITLEIVKIHRPSTLTPLLLQGRT
ncbi:hypothetical protein SDC9_190175 [bioreactor metagenome]|uniref:Uncharacterized protein n=1 Tax=bioreactor metagenome TaxID=1076179 RepID=A0A645HUB0_9ZZZZ